MVLTPAARDVGWVVSDDETIFTSYDPQNHFGDSFLYVGVLNEQVYHGAIQFDLARIPRGVKIYAASLRLTGLRADQVLSIGEWRLTMLGSEIDLRWRDHNFEQIDQASIWSTFEVTLTPEELGEGQVNLFEFTPEQLELLERRVLEGSDRFGRLVSFRLDGPTTGDDNLFAWDTGYGPASKGKNAMPQLFLSLGPTPEETPLPYYVVITSTPTPESIMTAVANSLRLTAEAERVGTATPLPPNWVTPVVVTPTPTAENGATAQAMQEMATAIALTTGEPPNLATATATPTYVIITSTPTPLLLETAAAQAAAVTAAAISHGTATPFPENWVTPVVVVSTPTPENTATATYLWAVALTTGTPTPTPGNVQTATPTPVMIMPTISPTTTPTPSPTFQPLPAALVGQIVFLSDREGATEAERLRADKLKVTPTVVPQPYVYDPQTGQVQRLTDPWPYQSAALRDAWSADKRYETYNQKLLWTNIDGWATKDFAIHTYDYLYNVETQVTRFGRGDAWDPAWSPVADRIALVSNDSGDDEIWVVNRDGSELVRLTETNEALNGREIGKDTFIPEVNGHPSWSPDGAQIVFWSNRSGQRQIWIMNADGSNQRLLMLPNAYNDWNPVWIKYQDPSPASLRQPDWRFVKPPEETGSNP
jgi:TolB protein